MSRRSKTKKKDLDANQIRTEAAQDSIRNHYDDISKSLPGKDLAPKMFAKKLLTDYEKQCVDAERTSYQRNQLILEALHRRSGTQFAEFLKLWKSLRVSDELVKRITATYERHLLELGLKDMKQGADAVSQPVTAQVDTGYGSLASPTHRMSPPAYSQPVPLDTRPPVTATADLPPSVDLSAMSRQDTSRVINCLISTKLVDIIQWNEVAPILSKEKLLTEAEFTALMHATQLGDRYGHILESSRRIGSAWLEVFWKALYATRRIQQHSEVLSTLLNQVKPFMKTKKTMTPENRMVLNPVNTSPRLSEPSHSQPGFPADSPFAAGLAYTGSQVSKGSSLEVQGIQSTPEVSTKNKEARLSDPDPLFADSSGHVLSRPKDWSLSDFSLTPGQTKSSVQSAPQRSRVNELVINCVKRKHLDNLKQVFKASSAHIDLSFKDAVTGKTAAHIAVVHNMFEGLRLMYEHPTFDPSVTDAEKRTVFHLAAIEGYDAYILTLSSSLSLERMQDVVNMMDQEGDTALHHACRGGHEQTCKALVQVCKCDVRIVNREGRTPIQIATIGKFDEIVAFLQTVAGSTKEDPPSLPKHSVTDSNDKDSLRQELEALRKDHNQLLLDINKERRTWAESSQQTTEAILSFEKSERQLQRSLKQKEDELLGVERLVKQLTRVNQDLEERHSQSIEEPLTPQQSPPLPIAAVSMGTSEMLLGSMLYGFAALKRDKLDMQRQVVLSDRYQTPTEHKLYMELEQENAVLRSSLASAQQKVSHLENDIQKRQFQQELVSNNVEEDFEDRQRVIYSKYRQDKLVDEVVKLKRTVYRYELLTIEIKTQAQRALADLDVQKSVNQALMAKVDVIRSNWESRIRELQGMNHKLKEKAQQLQEKINRKKSKDGKATEEDGMLAALPKILQEGTKIVLTKHSQYLREQQQQEVLALRDQKESRSGLRDLQAGSAGRRAILPGFERPPLVGNGNSESVPTSTTTFTVNGSETLETEEQVLSIPVSLTCKLGEALPLADMIDLFFKFAVEVQLFTLSVLIVNSSLEQSVLTMGRAKDVFQTPSAAILSFTPSQLESFPQFVRPLPVSMHNVSSPFKPSSLIASALQTILDPSVLRDSVNSSSKAFVPKGKKLKLSEAERLGSNLKSVAAIETSLFELAKKSLQDAEVIRSVPVRLPCVLIPPLFNREVSAGVMSALTLLFSSSPRQGLVRVFSQKEIKSLLDDAQDPFLQEFLTLKCNDDRVSIATPLVSIGCCGQTQDELASTSQPLHSFAEKVNELFETNCVSQKTFVLPATVARSVVKSATAGQDTEQESQWKPLIRSLTSITRDALPPSSFPLRWLHLLDVLQASQLQTVSFAEVCKVGLKVCHMGSDEVLSALKRLDQCGFIMYCAFCPQLKDLVIVDKSIFVQAISSLGEKMSTLEDDSQLFSYIRRGVVTHSMIEEVCRQNFLSPNTFIHLLLYKCILGLTCNSLHFATRSSSIQTYREDNDDDEDVDNDETMGKLNGFTSKGEKYLFLSLLPRKALNLPEGYQENLFFLEPRSSSQLQEQPEYIDNLVGEQLKTLSFLIESRSPYFAKCILPAVSQSFASSQSFVQLQCSSDACNLLTLHLDRDHSKSALHLTVCNQSEGLVKSESAQPTQGLLIDAKLLKSNIRSVLWHLEHAVSLVSDAYYGNDSPEELKYHFALICPFVGSHCIEISESCKDGKGRYALFCSACRKDVKLSGHQPDLLHCILMGRVAKGSSVSESPTPILQESLNGSAGIPKAAQLTLFESPQQLSLNELNHISVQVGQNFQELAEKLGLNSGDMDSLFTNKLQSPESKCYEILSRWLSSFSSSSSSSSKDFHSCSRSALYKALHQMGFDSFAQWLKMHRLLRS